MRITSLLMALLIVAGLYFWFVGRHEGVPKAEQRASAETVTPLSTAPTGDEGPEARPITVTIAESIARPSVTELIVRGRTTANRNIRVAAETNGRVVSEPKRRGALVREGEVICRLDPGVRMAELAEAEASLAEAQIEATAANALTEKGFTPETVLRARLARLEAAQARVDRVMWDIAQLEIHAPFDGLLESDSAEYGALLRTGDICANVIDLSRIKVAGFVSEREIDQLRIGQTATARLVNGLTTEGTITFLSRVADPATRTFGVEVTIDNPGEVIRDGMTAELTIALPSQRAHLIPQSAITLDDGGNMGVRLHEAGLARFVAIRILSDTADGFWVAGLPDSAEIIVIGQEFVRDGTPIQAVTADWKDAL